VSLPDLVVTGGKRPDGKLVGRIVLSVTPEALAGLNVAAAAGQGPTFFVDLDVAGLRRLAAALDDVADKLAQRKPDAPA